MFKEFTLLCKDISLLETDIAQAEQRAKEYIKALEFSDKENPPPSKIKNPPNDLDKLNKAKDKLRKNLEFLEKNDLNQFNTTDSDAKLMKKPNHNLMAYNSQIVVDDTYKFIVATDVTNIGADNPHLYPLAKEAKDVLNKKDMTLLADCGYYSLNGLKSCMDENVDTFIPMPKSSDPQKSKRVLF